MQMQANHVGIWKKRNHFSVIHNIVTKFMSPFPVYIIKMNTFLLNI